MGDLVLVDVTQYTALKNRVKKLQAEMKELPSRLVPINVSGVKASPGIVLAGGQDNYVAIDGLNITAWFDFDEVMVDFVCQVSGNTGVRYFAVEMDGRIVAESIIHTSPTTTAAVMEHGFMTLEGCKGRHRYRLMLSSDLAVTAILTDRNRSFRLTGLSKDRGKKGG